MKNKKLENVLDNALEWVPIAGLFPVIYNFEKKDRNTLINKNNIYLTLNGFYQGLSLIEYILFIFK